MIPVETVIRKLIVDYEFVILPGFGALLSHQVPASYDQNSGVFSPPDKRLAFNEFLKLDDGLLANFISRHEGISHAEAIAYVKRYTDKLRSVLELSGQAKIKGIGEFRTNKEGKLVFDPGDGKYFKDEWYGFQKVNAAVVTSRSIANRSVSVKSFEEEVEVLEEYEQGTRRINWWRWASVASSILILVYFSAFFVSNSQDNKSSLNPFPGLFTEQKESVAVEDAVTTDVEAEVQKPLVAPKLETVAEVVDSASVEPGPVANAAVETAPIASTAKFYVIAGAFKGNRQANVLLTQLKEKGFPDAVLLPADKSSTKVKVALQAYESESDAYKASARLKTVIGESGWVYKVK
jgi:cell division septation protein DedD/nucleoid DNA-binding protein